MQKKTWIKEGDCLGVVQNQEEGEGRKRGVMGDEYDQSTLYAYLKIE
jgi:hypothetical protein